MLNPYCFILTKKSSRFAVCKNKIWRLLSFFQCASLNNWTMKWWNVIQLFNCVVYKKNRFWDLIETIILYTLMIENFFANDVVIYGTIFDLMLQSFLITRKLHLRIKWRIINSIIILEKNSPFRARLVISGEGKAIQM